MDRELLLSLFVVTSTEFPQPGAGQEKAIYHSTEAHWEVVWMSVKRTKKAPRELTNSEEPPGGKRNMPVLLTGELTGHQQNSVGNCLCGTVEIQLETGRT